MSSAVVVVLTGRVGDSFHLSAPGPASAVL